MERKEELAEIAVQFHSLTMNGGFLDSFVALDSRLDEVVEAYELLRLVDPVNLIGAGMALVAGSGSDAPAQRRLKVEALHGDRAVELEDLGARYTELVTDALLFARIERYCAPATRLPRLPRAVPEMLAEFQSNVIERASFGFGRQVAKGNRLVTRNQKLVHHLRQTPQGRAGVWALRTHPNPAVRSAALIYALAWRPEEAAALLDEIEDTGGLGTFEVKWTLKMWRSGKLNLDW